jgi:hypothetical protein
VSPWEESAAIDEETNAAMLRVTRRTAVFGLIVLSISTATFGVCVAVADWRVTGVEPALSTAVSTDPATCT